jgi:hypothetical protein
VDYKRFYAEVVEWIGQANQMAVRYGIASETFWNWVTSSSADICGRYNDNPLVIKQMMMLTEWLDEALERSRKRSEREDRP